MTACKQNLNLTINLTKVRNIHFTLLDILTYYVYGYLF